jgi:hypothetical protein
MNLIERCINRVYPLAERRSVKAALGFLAQKFGLPDAPLPQVRRSSEGNYYAPTIAWETEDGTTRRVRIQHRIHLTPDAGSDSCGEEVGHYLHYLLNPQVVDSSTPAFLPADREGALEFLRIHNWVECLGRYAGRVYARSRSETDYTGAEHLACDRELRTPFRLMKHGTLEELLEWPAIHVEESARAQALTSAPSIRESIAADIRNMLRERYGLDLWQTLTHNIGYRASDELMKRDPGGASLAMLARLTPTEAREYAHGITAWRRHWAILEREHGDELAGLVQQYGRE